MLLIDEIDRADEAFEAFLLEILSDFQVTIPEIGVVKAPEPPIVVITSNRTREIHDALKRRCLYHWVGYPDAAREIAIVRAKAPRAPERLTARTRRLRPAPAQAGPVQVARRRRDARLGGRADRTRRGRARSGASLRYARRAAEISGRYRQDRRRQGADLIEQAHAEVARRNELNADAMRPHRAEPPTPNSFRPAAGAILGEGIAHDG